MQKTNNKSLDDNMKCFHNQGAGKDLSHRTQKAPIIKKQINIQNFCSSKNILKKVKKQDT